MTMTMTMMTTMMTTTTAITTTTWVTATRTRSTTRKTRTTTITTTDTTTTTLPGRSIPTPLNPLLPSNLITSSTTLSPSLSKSCQLRSSPTAITRQFRNQPTGE